MPKIKTKKSVVKRFHETGNGKLMHRHTSRAHSMVKKTPSQSRRLIKEVVMHPGKNKAIRRQMANGCTY